MGLSDSGTTVTIVTSHVSPTFGIAAATVSLAERLAEDHNVRIVTIDSADTLGFQHSSILHRAWGHHEMLGWKRVVTLARVIRHRAELLDGVTVLSGAWAAVPVLLASRRKSLRRTIVWEHSLIDQHVEASRRLRVLRTIARPLYRRAAATVVVSDLVADDLTQAGFATPIVIPNLIRPLADCAAGEPIDGRLLTMGALVKVKNQNLALETLALLPATYTLDIVGDGPDRLALEERARQLGIADRVNFCGYVANPEAYYSRAEIVVQPCEAETFGLVLFEAAHYRKPLVAPTGGMAGRVIPALVPGLTTKPEPHSFATAIESLKKTPIPDDEFDDAAHRRRTVQESIVPRWEKLIGAVDAAGRQSHHS